MKEGKPFRAARMKGTDAPLHRAGDVSPSRMHAAYRAETFALFAMFARARRLMRFSANAILETS
jgi:hypothetical protein